MARSSTSFKIGHAPYRNGGRPKQAKTLRAELVRRFGEDGAPLLHRLEELAKGRNPRVALSAVELLLAYLAGKPKQTFEHSGPDGGPIAVAELRGAIAGKLARLAAGSGSAVPGGADGA